MAKGRARSSSAISLAEIKRRVVIAMFSDDELMRTLVLKGGNALGLVHNIASRASFDLDNSMEKDFPPHELAAAAAAA